jgi:hypothetical protein
MLTEWQKYTLEDTPEDKPAPKHRVASMTVKEKMESIISNISRSFPELQLWWVDEWKMELFGKEVPRLYVLGNPKDFQKYIPQFNTIFRKPPLDQSVQAVIWQDGVPWPKGYVIEVYLIHHRAQEPNDHKKFFDIIQKDKAIKDRYKKILTADYEFLRQHLTAKYEFMNKVLLQTTKK